jgi:D-beta-D-heptose 7-phosphate kinase/D-beta-D-heptose 1-phosphate adenosyltransferase
MTTVITPLSRERLVELMGQMTGIRAAVVGDVMLDRYLMGDADRISPEAPVPVVSVDQEHSTPGGAANVAANVAAIGAEALLVGVIGDDDAGAALLESVASFEVAIEGLVKVPGRPTTTKTRIVARGQQVVRLDREVDNSLAGRHRDAIVEAAHRALEEADVLLLEDYDKGVLDPALISDLIAMARNRGIAVVADPKERHFFNFSGATLFKPNRRELGSAMRAEITGEDMQLHAARSELQVDHLLLTLGADGMALVSGDGTIRRTPSITREVFDVSGAGDTVAAWAGVALAAGATTLEAVWLANLAAGVEVGKPGTATVSTGEILDAWEQYVGE